MPYSICTHAPGSITLMRRNASFAPISLSCSGVEIPALFRFCSNTLPTFGKSDNPIIFITFIKDNIVHLTLVCHITIQKIKIDNFHAISAHLFYIPEYLQVDNPTHQILPPVMKNELT